MNERQFGRTEWHVTEISLGCGTHVENWNADEKRDFVATVHHALDLGMTYFDTADSYNTEEWLGEALGARRKDVLVSTKVGKAGQGSHRALSYDTPEDIYACCEASLKRLGTDLIDLYFCHLDPPPDPDLFLEAFGNLKKQGKIRAFGISTNDIDLLKTFNADGDCTACQLDYNILDRAAEAELLPYAKANGIATVIRRTLDKGILSGKLKRDQIFTDWVRQRWNEGEQRDAYQAKIDQVERLRPLERNGRSLVHAAIQFVLANSNVSCSILGAARPSRLDDYMLALRGELTAEDRGLIADVSSPPANSNR